MRSRATIFGDVADRYERYRPGYPREVADRIVEYAGRMPRTALEIGAGTGKATRILTERGIAVTATDPDAAMLAELRRHVTGPVTTVVAPFEALPVADPVDLVVAAASLHWTAPAGRWDRIAAMLAPEGVMAAMAVENRIADPDLAAAVAAAQAAAPSPGPVAEDPAGLQWPGDEMTRSPLFADVVEVRILRSIDVSAEDYVGLVSTLSSTLMLPPAAQTETLSQVRAVIPHLVPLRTDVLLHLARRAASVTQDRRAGSKTGS